jgi:hypothetical protein
MAEPTTAIPEEFNKVIKDFVYDIRNTFPEYDALINKWWKTPDSFANIENNEDRLLKIQQGEAASTKLLFAFCKKKYPPRFFDILYQNDELFKEDSEIDTEFLPHIYFKDLWQFDISQKTRDTIWKYLQLITFSIVGTLDNKDAFGETAKLFESLNQDDFKSKLEETIGKMQDLFNKDESEGLGNNLNTEDMPKADDLHEHITGMLDGKLGRLAREIAEETAGSINIDMDGATDMKDVLNNLIKNPAKLMSLVKNVGDKLDSKLKSGDIKESELMSEATDIMNKMKNMKGMGDIQSLLSKMGMGGMNMGGMNMGGKVDVNAMETQLNRNMKMMKTKERMRATVEAKRLAKLQQQAQSHPITPDTSLKPVISDEELVKIFSKGEKAEKTPRNPNKKKKNKTKN